MGYLDKALRPLVLIIPKKSRHFETFKVNKRIKELRTLNGTKHLEVQKKLYTPITKDHNFFY